MSRQRHSPVDWGALTQMEFIKEAGCWKSGCQSFCCNIAKPIFSFRFIKQDSSPIVYIPDEYAYMKKERMLPATVDGPRSCRTLSLDFGRPHPLEIILLSCQYCGNCHSLARKPLSCRLYPFLPAFSLEGKLVDFRPFNIIDLTCHERGIDPFCDLWRQRENLLADWQAHPEIYQPLLHPDVRFYLEAAGIFADNYLDTLRSNRTLARKLGTEFWQAWELLYLSGDLIDLDRLREDLSTLYDRLMPFSVGLETQ